MFVYAVIGWVLGLVFALMVQSVLAPDRLLVGYVLGGGLSLMGFILGATYHAKKGR